jgi:hypothetical protein
MAEWGVTEIVGQADGFNKVRIDKKVFTKKRGGLFQKQRDGAAYLGYFKRMGKPRAIKVEFAGKKNLGFGLKPSKGRTVNDPVSVCLKSRPVFVWFTPLQGLEIGSAIKSVFC